MVGKPNLTEEKIRKKDFKGSTMATPGLDALDEEREASMADEGGASGAEMDAQISETDSLDARIGVGAIQSRLALDSTRNLLFFASVATLIGVAIGLWRYRDRIADLKEPERYAM